MGRSRRHIAAVRGRGGRLSAWPPLPPGVWAAPANAVRPLPLGSPGRRFSSRARRALCCGLRALSLGPGDAVLAPAYHPTAAEMFPTVLLEALAAGVPIVASAVGGIPEIVEDRQAGRLRAVYDEAVA